MVSHGLLLQNPSSGLTSQHGKVGPPCFLPFCFLARIGFEGAKYDIKSAGMEEDITTRVGWLSLLLQGLRLAENALLFLGPPCSMFIFLTSSQHQRHKYGPMGDPRDRTSQLANAIAANAVPCIQQCPCIFSKIPSAKRFLVL